ncbi:unnamed protein product [Ectocarpus sp. 12 AP-2014]
MHLIFLRMIAVVSPTHSLSASLPLAPTSTTLCSWGWCPSVIAQTAGSVESVFEDRPDGASSMSFKTMVNTAAVGTRSYNPVQFKFTFHIKQPLRQVIIYSKPQWSLPTRQIHAVRQFVTQANHRLNVGTLEVDDSADVSISYKTAAEFGGINDITPVLTSFMKAHAGIGLDCFRALTVIKDADVDVTHALGMIDMVGPTGEMSTRADDKLSAMLTVLSAPA